MFSYTNPDEIMQAIRTGQATTQVSADNSLVSRRRPQARPEIEEDPVEQNKQMIKDYLEMIGATPEPTQSDKSKDDVIRPVSRADGLGVFDLATLGGDWVDVSAQLLRDLEGFKNEPYYDVNAFRAGYGSDTYTTEDGTIKTVKKGDFVSREDAERDLYRRIETEFGAKAKQAAGEAWESYNPMQRAALTSIAYNYGSIPKRISSAVKSGDARKVSDAIVSLADDNDGINFNRRIKEAEMMIYGGSE